MRVWSAVVLVLLCAAPALADLRLVAVLPLDTRGTDLSSTAREALEETLRTAAGDLLRPYGYTVLTSDNTLSVLADNDIDPERACEASCALEMARELRAEVFVSGRVTALDDVYVAFIRLSEYQRGQQLASLDVEANTARELRAILSARAAELFLPLRSSKGAPVPEGRIDARPTELPDAGGREAIVTFESSPNEALVRIDGTIVCQKTPCRRAVPLGAREVVMELERHLPARKVVTLREEETVRLELAPTFGLVNVITSPRGLDLTVNGRPGGRSPVVLELEPDVYEILLADRCHLPEGERVLVKQGQRRELKIEARPREALVRVHAVDRQKDAVPGKVVVDRRDLGRVPGAFRVPVCAREIEVVADDGRRWTGTLKLEEGRETTVEARLESLYPSPLQPAWTKHPTSSRRAGIDVPTWAWWLAGVGTATWIGAGTGALVVHEDLKTLLPSDPMRDQRMATGRGLLVVSNVGAAALGVAVVGTLLQNVGRF